MHKNTQRWARAHSQTYKHTHERTHKHTHDSFACVWFPNARFASSKFFGRQKRVESQRGRLVKGNGNRKLFMAHGRRGRGRRGGRGKRKTKRSETEEEIKKDSKENECITDRQRLAYRVGRTHRKIAWNLLFMNSKRFCYTISVSVFPMSIPLYVSTLHISWVSIYVSVCPYICLSHVKKPFYCLTSKMRWFTLTQNYKY